MKTNTKELLNTVKLAAKLKGGVLSFAKQFRLRPIEDGKITVEATNCEVFFIRQVYGQGTLDHPVLVNRVALTKALTSAVKRGDEVTLTLDTSHLDVTAGSMKVRILVTPSEDMPEPPQIDDNAQSFIATNAKKYLGALVRYVSKEDSRPTLNDICMLPSGKVVATDGCRLLAIECLDESPTEQVYLATAAVKLALAAFSTDDYAINVGKKVVELTAFNGTKVVFHRPDHGTYPDIVAVLSSAGAATHFDVDAKALKALATDVAPWTHPKIKSVRVDMKDGEPAQLYASNPDLGEMLLDIEGSECAVSMVRQGNTHPDHSFDVNVAFLKEAAEIQALFGDVIRVECAEWLSPVSFLAPDGDGAVAVAFNHVVMPMRI